MYDKDFSYPSVGATEDITNATNVNIKDIENNIGSICKQEDKIIQDQTSQMLMLIQIIEAYRKDKLENREMCEVQKRYSDQRVTELRRVSYVQIMIFGLIMLFVLVYVYKNKITGDK